jgi:hypothetical protein
MFIVHGPAEPALPIGPDSFAERFASGAQRHG